MIAIINKSLILKNFYLFENTFEFLNIHSIIQYVYK